MIKALNSPQSQVARNAKLQPIGPGSQKPLVFDDCGEISSTMLEDLLTTWPGLQIPMLESVANKPALEREFTQLGMIAH